ncbi:MAG TPA: amidohydrolase family protein [Gemmatimonadaceae bacterium]|nr:amidohydrolase family protein [Gemmatimonadaceae bacterium]
MVVALALLLAAARPSADSTHYIVLNHGRSAGEMYVLTSADSVVVRYRHQDRQRGPRFETVYRLGANRRVLAMETRSVTPEGRLGPVTQHVDFYGDSVRSVSSGDTTRMRDDPTSYFVLDNASPFDNARLAKFLLSRPQQTSRLYPDGTGHAEVVADTSVTVDGASRRIRLVFVSGLGTSVDAVWLDESSQLFASGAGWFITVPREAAGVLPALREIEKRIRAAKSEALARRLTPPAPKALVIRNGNVFDSEKGVVRNRVTVLIEGDRIKAVGPADSIRTPAGATVIDATGKTVIPGLWDMHTHLFLAGEEAGSMQLAAGITSVRDVASDIDAAVSQRERSRLGTMLSPRIILAGFIEGPGNWAGPTEVLVRTEAEARAWVARYDSLGYKQIKLYNLVHPDLVPVVAEEAHKRGMRLSGHIPRGLTVQSAVKLGFDEFQHAAFLFSTFYQDSLYVPRMRAYSAVATDVAPTFDVYSPQVTELISFLRDRGTVVDGTFNVWQDTSHPLPDGTDAVMGPTISWMPPLMARGYRGGPPASPTDAARTEAASTNYRRMLKRLYDAGVTLVPGTDNVPGLSLHGELEVYERAGIPAPAVLQIATIVPARVMKDDKDYGSITPGKIADLAIVNGKPAEHITDLRRTERVVRAGRVYESKALYETVGINPKW